MSKRYYFDSIGCTIGDNETNDFLNGYQVAKLLNELCEKNQKLKSFRATTYELINDYLLDSDEVNESWREVLTEIKEILKDEENGRLYSY